MEIKDISRKTPPMSVAKRLAAGAALLTAVAFITGVVGPIGSATGAPTVMTSEQVSQIRSQLDKQLKSSSAEQREALQDGKVEAHEIESLAMLASACSVDGGNPPIEVSFQGDAYQWSVDFGLGASNREERMAEVDECWYRNVGLTEQYYGLQRVQPVDEQVIFNKAVVACLAAKGFNADGWPHTKAEIDPAAESICVDAAEGD